MNETGLRNPLAAAAAWGLLLTCGCIPSSWLPSASHGPGAPAVAGAAPVSPAAPGGPPGAVGGINLAGYGQLAEHQAADLSQKLAELQDENKSLTARLQGMQLLVEERERAVLAGRGEVQAAAQEVAQARQEVSRCRQEITSLREHIRAALKENQASLQALTNVLETLLEGDNPQPATGPEKKESKPLSDKETRPRD
jgi:hypothetical protein